MRLKRCRRPMTRQLRCGVWGAKDRRVAHAVQGQARGADTRALAGWLRSHPVSACPDSAARRSDGLAR